MPHRPPRPARTGCIAATWPSCHESSATPSVSSAGSSAGTPRRTRCRGPGNLLEVDQAAPQSQKEMVAVCLAACRLRLPHRPDWPQGRGLDLDQGRYERDQPDAKGILRRQAPDFSTESSNPLVEAFTDNTQTPVDEAVAFRIDFPAWISEPSVTATAPSSRTWRWDIARETWPTATRSARGALEPAPPRVPRVVVPVHREPNFLFPSCCYPLSAARHGAARLSPHGLAQDADQLSASVCVCLFKGLLVLIGQGELLKLELEFLGSTPPLLRKQLCALTDEGQQHRERATFSAMGSPFF